MSIYRAAALLSLCLSGGGCTSAIQSQTDALTLTDKRISQREIQGRRFDTHDNLAILRASAGVLQDLGFSIDETSPNLGILSGSKERDAVEFGQVAVAFAAALAGVSTSIEKTQKIQVSLVVSETPDGYGVIVRTTFQRVIWNTQNRISRLLPITDAALYQQFYDKLSQSVFLQAHDL